MRSIRIVVSFVAVLAFLLKRGAGCVHAATNVSAGFGAVWAGLHLTSGRRASGTSRPRRRSRTSSPGSGREPPLQGCRAGGFDPGRRGPNEPGRGPYD